MKKRVTLTVEEQKRLKVITELDRWEAELLEDLSLAVYLSPTLPVSFNSVRRVRTADRELAQLKIGLPATR